MITPEEAKQQYGFKDCTEYEDNMTLGLYHAMQAWFRSPAMRALDGLLPIFIAALIFAALFGMITVGPHPMLLLLAGGLSLAFIPQYWKVIKLRRENSGMIHIQSLHGTHFLTARGVCVKKTEEAKVGLGGRKVIRSLRVKLNNGKYLDDVLVIKELYDEIKEGASVNVLMADSDLAWEIIGAPSSFTDMVIDAKKVSMQQFGTAKAGSIRELSGQERAMYTEQFEDRITNWKNEYQKKFLFGAAICFAAGAGFLLLGAQALALLTWIIAAYSLITLYMQLRDFKRLLRIIQETEPLTAVDVIVRREDSYQDDMGTKKRSSSSVSFRDGSGRTLWTLRDTESLRTFLQGEGAILIISGKEMIPLHRNTRQYTIHP